jgi:hypothetical protein
MVKLAAMIAFLTVAACGGKQPQAETTPADDTSGGGETAAAPTGGVMVPPEKMDEVQRLLERKQGIVSRCLATAVDNQELPKNSRGKMTLEIVISEAGKANDVKVVNSSLDSPKLQTCVVDIVKEIQFPTLPKSYPTSYTYAFEAM